MATSFKGWGSSWGNSWGTVDVNPNAMTGNTSFAINATGTLTAESQLADTHDGYFTNTWLAQWKKKPELSEVVEYVEAHPQEALEVVQSVAPKQAQGITVAQIDYGTKIAESLAKQILSAISRRQLELQRDEEDAEFLLLMD